MKPGAIEVDVICTEHFHPNVRTGVRVFVIWAFLLFVFVFAWLCFDDHDLRLAKHREGVAIDKCDRLSRRIDALESQLQKPSPVCIIPFSGPIQPRVIVASRHGRRHRRHRG